VNKSIIGHDYGHQLVALAERLSRGHPYTTAATTNPNAVDATIPGQEARSTPGAVANTIRPQPADYIVAATASLPSAAPLAWLRPHHGQWRARDAQCHEHTTAIGVAA